MCGETRARRTHVYFKHERYQEKPQVISLAFLSDITTSYRMHANWMVENLNKK
jgi:hypothetical protein